MGLKSFSLRERAFSQTRSIAQWSSEYFQHNNRPLRIAIDQANWWFRNVTPQKEKDIQRNCPGSHPREKRILERLHYLLRMNVQVIFVFDGPDKPWKRRPNGQNYSEENVVLLKEILFQLGIPHHEAPGEAEAECARLEALGVVDAVWSDDSDTFMFGCTTLIQFHKPEGSEFKSEDQVLVYTADSIIERSKLSREGLIMYAILVGCDYSDGLPNFGTSTLLDIAKHPKFQETATVLVKSSSNDRELSKWRAMLFGMIKATFPKKNFTIPPKDFPNSKVLKSCCCPNVSSDSKLKGLVTNWFIPFGPRLYHKHMFLIRHFHLRKTKDWTAEYLVAIELNHRLLEGPSNYHYAITEKTAVGPRGESTITVDPVLVIPQFLHLCQRGDMNTGLPEKLNKVNVTLLDCVIRHGLPNLVEKASKKGARGRPRKGAPKDGTEPALPSSAPRPRGRPRKGGSVNLEENNNHNSQDPNIGPKRQADPTELLTAPARDEDTLGKFSGFVIDNEDGENRDPNQRHGRYKRQKVDVPSPADTAIVHLTGVD
ncbi:PIN domain-like protein [Hypoxylon sp. EC38]|nr:PIN domain-like protein [Hypoxylon sp. EC38]